MNEKEKLVNALLVMVLDARIRAFLETNDPMALKQAKDALTANGIVWEELKCFQ